MSLLPKRKSHKDEPIFKADKKERQKWKIMELIPDNPPYTAYQKLEALTTYMVKGSIKKTSDICNIPYSTIQSWIRVSNWWKPALQELRIQKDDELDSRITGFMDKVLNQMEDRLEHGDEKVAKDGSTIRVKVSFRDLALAGIGILYDKRALTRRQPTALIEHTNEGDRLKRLAKMFESIQNPKIIEGTSEVLPNKDKGEEDAG